MMLRSIGVYVDQQLFQQREQYIYRVFVVQQLNHDGRVLLQHQMRLACADCLRVYQH